MATKLIMYDLNAPGQNYKELHEAIKSLGSGWWHHLDSAWLVRTNLGASEIRDRLRPHLSGGNDELLVVDVTGDSRAWMGFSERGSNWLKTTWDLINWSGTIGTPKNARNVVLRHDTP